MPAIRVELSRPNWTDEESDRSNPFRWIEWPTKAYPSELSSAGVPEPEVVPVSLSGAIRLIRCNGPILRVTMLESASSFVPTLPFGPLTAEFSFRPTLSPPRSRLP